MKNIIKFISVLLLLFLAISIDAKPTYHPDVGVNQIVLVGADQVDCDVFNTLLIEMTEKSYFLKTLTLFTSESEVERCRTVFMSDVFIISNLKTINKYQIAYVLRSLYRVNSNTHLINCLCTSKYKILYRLRH